MGIGNWISERLKTIADAIGVKRFAIDGAVGTAIAASHHFASRWPHWPLASTPDWFIWFTIVFILLFWWMLNYAVDLRKQKQPKIGIRFDSKDNQYINETFNTNDPLNHLLYVVLKPTALTSEPIQDCKGYLKAVYKLDQNGEWDRTNYSDRQQLEWGAIGYESQTLSHNDTISLNVFRVSNHDGEIRPTIKMPLNRHGGVFSDRNGVYRFDIIVMGANATPAEIALEVRYGSDGWNDVQVKTLEVPK